jgi:hypothetical protein
VVGAGDSARLEAELSAERARRLQDELAAEEQRARSFAKGGAAELVAAQMLGELSAHDIHALHDRRWPGTRSANIDHLVVGTSGVFVVDTKDWSDEVTITSTGLMRGQASCADELDKSRRMANAVLEELAEEGLAPGQVLPVLAFHGKTIGPHNVDGVWVVGAGELPIFILRRGRLFTQMQVEQLLTRVIASCPPAATPPDSAPVRLPPVAVPAPVSPAAEELPLISQEAIEAAALEAALRAPLADWMTFLHPTQARLVHRSLNGPSRISGPAGTGKTVVALHRLAYLADRRRGRLLYVTFVKSVPRVLRGVYRQLSSHTARRVEFSTLHSWSVRFLRGRGIATPLDRKGIDAAFSSAWRRVGQDTALASVAPARYWKDEVQRVIRGRAIDRFEDYLTLDRVGRGTRLGSQQRRAVWTLLESYQEELAKRGLMDWEELLRVARDECRRRPPEPEYDVVVVDEAQDMTLVAMQLIRLIAGDKPDGLLIVGDDQQRIFPGGYRLSEAGIDVTGRSTRLATNYRNTREVLEAARELVYGDDEDLLEGLTQPADVEMVRTGVAPIYLRAPRAQHDAAFVSQLSQALASRLAPADGVAVIAERWGDEQAVRSLLVRHRIPQVDLDDWDGSPTTAVIVGTQKSAKGLEFKHVFVPYVAPELTEPDSPADEFEAEQWRMRRRELYVAMTRARDTLWVGSVDSSVGEDA